MDGGLLRACHVQCFLDKGVVRAIKYDKLELAFVDAKAGHAHEDHVHDVCGDVPTKVGDRLVQ